MGLTREDILAGRIEEKVMEAERMGLTIRLTPEQRLESKRAVLAQFAADEEIWLFGYGSLMWNPCIHYVDRQTALLDGYRRSYCLRTPMGRGTPEQPGLMLGLEPDGCCHGMAFRLDPELAEAELDIVWNREMVSGAYLPHIVSLETPLGLRRAATFVVNQQHPRYIAGLSLETMADIIAVAGGWLGTCADYLSNTVEHLDELGIRDDALNELMQLVKVRQAG